MPPAPPGGRLRSLGLRRQPAERECNSVAIDNRQPAGVEIVARRRSPIGRSPSFDRPPTVAVVEELRGTPQRPTLTSIRREYAPARERREDVALAGQNRVRGVRMVAEYLGHERAQFSSLGGRW